MTFKEGLMRSRSQLAFIGALIVSLTLIVWLESYDTRAGKVTASVQVGELGADQRDQLRQRAEKALVNAENGLAPDSQESIATYLTAVVVAAELGIVDRPKAVTMIETVLSKMKDAPAPALDAALVLAETHFPEIEAQAGANFVK